MTGKRYKATAMSGRDFYTGTIDYAAALASGEKITHPILNDHSRTSAAYYLSVATVPTDCTGMSWPCRLFEVEPDDEWVPEAIGLPNKRATLSLKVVVELDATQALGPQGPQVVALIEQIRSATAQQIREVNAARDAARDAARVAALDAARVAALVAARDAARDAARGTARDAALDAARVAAWDAARDAALAIVTKDLITPEQYQILAGPWESVFGEIS